MAGITLESNLAVANATVNETIGRIFSQGLPGSFQEWTQTIPCEGNSLELVVVDGVPRVREWLGSKQSKSLRAYKKSVSRRRWEATLSLSRATLDGDKSGAVGQRIADFGARVSRMPDDIMYSALLANAITGYDGQALLANSHPNVNGTTYDNLTTSGLSHAEWKTAVNTMEECTDESGEPLGMYPTHLICGPDSRRVAMEIAGPTRLVAVSNAGVENATSSVVAAGQYENYLGQSINVIISPRIRGAEWFAMDLGKPGLRPYFLAEFRKPELISMTDMNSHQRFFLDEYLWSMEADLSPVPAAYQCSYGSVSA